MLEQLIEKKELSINSHLINLKMVTDDEVYYNIPIYQRLYVWGSDQINTLLEDLFRSFEKEEKFYLGGIIIIKNAKNEDTFDLIDGQQRFTTLWLLGYILKYDLEAFIYSKQKSGMRKRLSFAIRDFANNYFDNPESISRLTTEEKKELKPIEEAVGHIVEFLKDKSIEQLKLFSKYVNENVQLISTEMPLHIDENKLFEVMNNRGIQLQHHEILKAHLIEKLEDKDKAKFAKIWESCSIMDEYIEKNIKDIVGCSWKDLTFNPDDIEREVGLPKDILNLISVSEDKFEKKHLLEILSSESKVELKTPDNDLDYDSGKPRSIISFPMLLLHTLRVFLFKQINKSKAKIVDNVEINEKKLLDIFRESFDPNFLNKEGVEEFILTMWNIRLGFDKYVIKWIKKDENNEVHLIKKLYLNKDALQRKEPLSNDGFALLQSMLYNSQQIITHYWLTPFLYKILESDDILELYEYLKKLDNVMFCSETTSDLRERSWNLIGKDLNNFQPQIQDLKNSKGTDYRSYWFYKLEFILWYFRDEVMDKFNIKQTSKDAWDSYRMTKKNSVEHISPQNPKEYDINKIWEDSDNEDTKKRKLDDFGNLVLLSVGMNSEYSNKTYNAKRTDFLDKKRLDSLKSALIFENSEWNWELCEFHRNEMIDYFTKYFNHLHNVTN